MKNQKVATICKECAIIFHIYRGRNPGICPCCSNKLKMRRVKEVAREAFYNYMSNSHPALRVLSPYIDNRTKILTECTICNEHRNRLPSTIRITNSCSSCARLQKVHSKLSTINRLRPDLEIVSNSLNLDNRVVVKCSNNHTFSITYYGIQQGTKCKECSKRDMGGAYKYNEDPCILYYIYFPEYKLWKIGITKNTIRKRFRKNLVIDTILLIPFAKGSTAYIYEQEIKSINSSIRYSGPKFLIGGETECFTSEPNIQILNQVMEK